jgi:hypothetical protein
LTQHHEEIHEVVSLLPGELEGLDDVHTQDMEGMKAIHSLPPSGLAPLEAMINWLKVIGPPIGGPWRAQMLFPRTWFSNESALVAD